MPHRHNIERHLKLRPKDVAKMPTDEVAALVHELQVNQIELDLQNDELRRTERELEESRNYLAELFDGAPVAYLTINRGGIVRDVNRAAGELLGCTREQCIGQPLWRFVIREDRDTLYLHQRRIQLPDAVAVSTCQLRIQRLDGEVCSVIMKSTPRGDDVHVALLDETARLRAEAELRALAEHLEERVAERTAEAERHAQELAASQAQLRAREAELRQAQKMHAIGRLASGVAHEFNNLLMGIMGSADMCLDALDPKSDVAVMLRRLRESASGGAEIVKQLLLFSRKEDEAGTSSPDAVLEANERLLRKTVGEDVDLRVMLGAPRLFVPCSSVWLGQILLNLAMNARQAMPKGGKLTIQTQVLAIAGGVTGTLSSLPAGDYLALQVRDTGVGMDEATRSRAFEPFFTTKAIGEGTGIGLSTVYGIVDRAGGRVFIDSEVGIGTVVTVVLPVTESFEEAAPRSRAVSAYELDGLTALVVEDEPLVREALRHYLESAGMNVIEAPDGEEALSLYREHEPSIDLVVTDIALPKMAGDELARVVRKPLLCVSAYSTVDLRRQGRLLPNVRTLQKPFAVNDLLEAVRKTLGP